MSCGLKERCSPFHIFRSGIRMIRVVKRVRKTLQKGVNRMLPAKRKCYFRGNIVTFKIAIIILLLAYPEVSFGSSGGGT